MGLSKAGVHCNRIASRPWSCQSLTEAAGRLLGARVRSTDEGLAFLEGLAALLDETGPWYANLRLRGQPVEVAPGYPRSSHLSQLEYRYRLSQSGGARVRMEFDGRPVDVLYSFALGEGEGRPIPLDEVGEEGGKCVFCAAREGDQLRISAPSDLNPRVFIEE